MTIKRIQEFDGLRALAVLLVIADHYAPFRTFANGAPARFGGIGVDVFFVLSGFLITSILVNLKTTARRFQIFYARRTLRIVPPFLLLLAFVFGIGWLRHEPLEKSKLAGQLLFLRSFKGSSEIVQEVRGVASGKVEIPHLFARIPEKPVEKDYPELAMSGSLGPTWSLSVEEWFYFLWAPVILLCNRRSALWIAGSACVFGFAMRWLGASGINFFGNVDIPMVGGVLAFWIEKRATLPPPTRKRIDNCISVASSLAFTGFIAINYLERTLISRTLIEVFVFGALSWLISHAGQAYRVCRFLRLKSLGYFGVISYMIYLIHLPMYFVCRALLSPHLSQVSELSRVWIIALASISGTLLFSALSWRFYEEPILGLKDVLTRWVEARPRRRVWAKPAASCVPSPEAS